MQRLRSILFLGLLLGPTSVGTAMILEPQITNASASRQLPRGAVLEGIEGEDLLPTANDRLRDGELEYVRRGN